MRTTLDIDNDVLGAAKDLAAQRNQSAGKVISNLLREALKPTRAAGAKKRNGIPLLVQAVGVRRTTLADVNSFRDDD